MCHTKSMDISILSVQEKWKCNVWPGTFKGRLEESVRGILRLNTRRTSPARTTIPKKVDGFNNLGSVENIYDQGRASILVQKDQTVIFYFLQHQTSSLRKAVAYLKTPYSTIQKISKSWFTCFHTEEQEYTSYTKKIVLNKLCFLVVWGHVFAFWLLILDCFSWWRCFSCPAISKHSDHLYLGPKNPGNIE